MQVSHIEVAGMIAQEFPQAHRKKRLLPIGESIGDVPKNVMGDPATLRDALKDVPYLSLRLR
jgi:hypothetical protein